MHGIVAVLAVLSVASGPVDKDQLRKSIDLPEISLLGGLYYNNGLFEIPDKDAFLPDEIAAAEKAVAADPQNPEVYRKLALIYDRSKDFPRRNAANNKAAELYRTCLDQHPENGIMRARHVDFLRATSDSPRQNWAELDAETSKAIASNAGEWECWITRSELLCCRAVMALIGKSVMEVPSGPAAVMELISRGQITDANLSAARRILDEAIQCADRAATLAPNRAEPCKQRMQLVTAEVLLEWARQSLHGEVPEFSLFLRLSLRHLPELWHAALCSPDDCELLGGAACLELQQALSIWKGKPTGLDSIPTLSENARKSIRQAIGYLRQQAALNDRRVKAFAAEVLAKLSILAGEPCGAEVFLADVVRSRPLLEAAWDLRIQLLMTNPRSRPEFLAACLDRLRAKDNAHNRFLLALAYFSDNQTDKAREQLELGAQNEADDLDSALGLAAVLMRTGNAADLDRAGRLLNVAKVLFAKTPNKRSFQNYSLLRCTYLALNDRITELQEFASNFKAADATDDRFARFERIVGAETLLEPPPGTQILPVSGTSK